VSSCLESSLRYATASNNGPGENLLNQIRRGTSAVWLSNQIDVLTGAIVRHLNWLTHGECIPAFNANQLRGKSPNRRLRWFRCGSKLSAPERFARFVQNSVTVRSVSRIQTDRQFLLRKMPDLLCRSGADLRHCRSLFSCASSASITWKRIACRLETALPSHLVFTIYCCAT
jgi:hypothetical protein